MLKKEAVFFTALGIQSKRRECRSILKLESMAVHIFSLYMIANVS